MCCNMHVLEHSRQTKRERKKKRLPVVVVTLNLLAIQIPALFFLESYLLLWWAAQYHTATCSLPISPSGTGERIGRPKVRKPLGQDKNCLISEEKGMSVCLFLPLLHLVFIAKHDVIQYGLSIGSAWVSCPICVHPSLLPVSGLPTGRGRMGKIIKPQCSAKTAQQ